MLPPPNQPEIPLFAFAASFSTVASNLSNLAMASLPASLRNESSDSPVLLSSLRAFSAWSCQYTALGGGGCRGHTALSICWPFSLAHAAAFFSASLPRPGSSPFTRAEADERSAAGWVLAGCHMVAGLRAGGCRNGCMAGLPSNFFSATFALPPDW